MHIEYQHHRVTEALDGRAALTDFYSSEILSRHGVSTIPCRELNATECAEHVYSTLDDFLAEARGGAARTSMPRVLDMDGRTRSGYLLSDDLRGADVVADNHEMSAILGEGFNVVFCASVLEHLVMPWKPAIEMKKVLTEGGIAFVQT